MLWEIIDVEPESVNAPPFIFKVVNDPPIIPAVNAKVPKIVIVAWEKLVVVVVPPIVSCVPDPIDKVLENVIVCVPPNVDIEETPDPPPKLIAELKVIPDVAVAVINPFYKIFFITSICSNWVWQSKSTRIINIQLTSTINSD
jgi:hypothetical protein